MNKYKALLLAIPLMILMVMPVNATMVFTDVPANHWAADTIQWGTDQSVTKGYPDGTFRPEATVTEAEFLAMLERSFVKEMADGTPWYKPYYDLAYQNNYPVTSTPDNVILRSQVAEIVAGTQGVNYTGDNAIQYLLGKGLAQGYDKNVITIGNYHGADTLNRAQAVQFIKNLKDNGIQEIKARPFDPSPVSELPALPAQPGQPVLIGKIAVPDNPNLKIDQYNATLPLTLSDGTIIKSITLGKDGSHDAVIIKADRNASVTDVYISLYFGDKRLGPVRNADTNSVWWKVGDGYEAYCYIYDGYNKPFLDVAVNVPDTVGIRSSDIYWIPNPLK